MHLIDDYDLSELVGNDFSVVFLVVGAYSRVCVKALDSLIVAPLLLPFNFCGLLFCTIRNEEGV